MNSGNAPLSELLRPQELQDLTLADRDITRLQSMLERMSPMNMLFYGPPGLGKTSAARIFLKARGSMGGIEINGSLTNGIEAVRDIERAASSFALTPGLKICFIDEADFMTAHAQASLRGVIERLSSNCRFILAANDAGRLSEAIRSRMISVSFAIRATDRPAILARIQARLAQRLAALGVPFEAVRLNWIIANYFPDLRQAISRLEYEFCF